MMKKVFLSQSFTGPSFASLVDLGALKDQRSHVTVPLTVLYFTLAKRNVNGDCEAIVLNRTQSFYFEAQLWNALRRHVVHHLQNMRPFPILKDLPNYYHPFGSRMIDPLIQQCVVHSPHAGGLCGGYAQLVVAKKIETQNEVLMLTPKDLIEFLVPLRDTMKKNSILIRKSLPFLKELYSWWNDQAKDCQLDTEKYPFSWQCAISLLRHNLSFKDFHKRRSCHHFDQLGFSLCVAAQICQVAVIIAEPGISIKFIQVQERLLSIDEAKIVIVYLHQRHFYVLPYQYLHNEIKSLVDERIATIHREQKDQEAKRKVIFMHFYVSDTNHC